MASEPTSNVKSNTSNTIGHEEFAAIKQDMQQLKTDLADLVAAMKTSGQNKAEAFSQDAINTLHDAIDTLGQRLNSAKAGVKEKTGVAADKTEELIERHPVASLITAFGIGFVLAKLFSKD